ncbi:MAG: hypothetical protein IKU15_07820 [Clostridia bacterium]|nr:hypothetical protein [Clostridia bacterium]
MATNSNVEETIVVPDGNNNFLAGMLASACQSKGLDASAVIAAMNGNNRNGFDLDSIIALVVVAAIFGNGNFGFGNNNNNRYGQGEQMIMDAIQRNGIDISQLASTLNCSIGQVQAAIQQVSSQICNVGNQVGMTGQQVINAIQQGNMSLTQQICNCCCDIKQAISNQSYQLQGEINLVNRSVERGFADLGYATRDQTCSIEKAIAASTESILAGQRAAEMREMQREIAERDRRIAEQSVIINNAQQSAAFSQMIASAIGPVNAGLAALNGKIAGIECRLPETKVIACPDNYVRVNTDVNAAYQLTPTGACSYPGFAYGFPANWQWQNGGWG